MHINLYIFIFIFYKESMSGESQEKMKSVKRSSAAADQNVFKCIQIYRIK